MQNNKNSFFKYFSVWQARILLATDFMAVKYPRPIWGKVFHLHYVFFRLVVSKSNIFPVLAGARIWMSSLLPLIHIAFKVEWRERDLILVLISCLNNPLFVSFFTLILLYIISSRLLYTCQISEREELWGKNGYPPLPLSF